MNDQFLSTIYSVLKTNLVFNSSLQDSLQKVMNYLRQFPNTRFLLLFDKSQPYLMPLEVGVNPSFLTSYVISEESAISTYLVDPDRFLVEKISLEQAEKLAYELPINLSMTSDFSVVEKSLCDLLGKGVAKGVWDANGLPGIPYSNWREWLIYFKSTRNNVMTSVMEKSIHLRDVNQCIRLAS